MDQANISTYTSNGAIDTSTYASNSASQSQIINPAWEMFQIIGVLGEGAYGKVFKVKCLRSSVISGAGNVLTPTMRMRKKLTKNMLGYNMGSSISDQTQVRQLFLD